MAVHTLPRDPQDKTSSVLPVFSVSVSKVNTQTQIASVLSQTQQTPDHGCLQTPAFVRHSHGRWESGSGAGGLS